MLVSERGGMLLTLKESIIVVTHARYFFRLRYSRVRCCCCSCLALAAASAATPCSTRDTLLALIDVDRMNIAVPVQLSAATACSAVRMKGFLSCGKGIQTR